MLERERDLTSRKLLTRSLFGFNHLRVSQIFVLMGQRVVRLQEADYFILQPCFKTIFDIDRWISTFLIFYSCFRQFRYSFGCFRQS